MINPLTSPAPQAGAPAFHDTFFNSLVPVSNRGVCPICFASGLDLRAAPGAPRGPRYVNHCGTVRIHPGPQRLEVLRALAADAEANGKAQS